MRLVVSDKNTSVEDPWIARAPRSHWKTKVAVLTKNPEKFSNLGGAATREVLSLMLVSSAEALKDLAGKSEIDAVVVELHGSNENLLDTIRNIRADLPMAVIAAGSEQADEYDCIVSLELGADDFLRAPIKPRELVARVRAILRRSSRMQVISENIIRAHRFRFGDWELNLRRRSLTSLLGQNVPLSKGEFALLAAFVKAPQRVLTREQLLTVCRVHNNEVFDRSIDVQVLRLRRKLEQIPSKPVIIVTHRGVGYQFAQPVEVI